MTARLTAALLAAHLLYLAVLPSFAAKAVCLLGSLVALAFAVGPVVSQRAAAAAALERSASDHRRAGFLLAWFALPLISLVAQPTVAFWRVDGRALLILAWLGAVSTALSLRGTSTPDGAVGRAGGRSVLTQLFILWSAAFWLMLIWDVGVGRAVFLVTKEDRLTVSFGLWETRPVRDHLFLAWLSGESFEKGVAYTNHLHPILFFFYACSKLVQLATGLPLYVGRNVTPFVMAAVGTIAFAALVPRTPFAGRIRFHSTLFVALGVFLTQWHFWVYPYTWGFDTVFPVIAYLAAIVWASAQPRLSPGKEPRLLIALVLFAAFGWLYTPLLVLALWILFARVRPTLRGTLDANRALVRASAAALAFGAAVYALPLLLVTLRGYENTSSSFLFRSGLDADTRYFQNAVQAVFNPFIPARSSWSVIFPGFVPILIAAACAWTFNGSTRRRLARQTVFLLTPYLFSLALFPQSVSIHPYLYDVLLILPVLLIGTTWALGRCVQRRLKGAFLLAAVLLSIMLIMANLTAIARGIPPLIPS